MNKAEILNLELALRRPCHQCNGTGQRVIHNLDTHEDEASICDSCDGCGGTFANVTLRDVAGAICSAVQVDLYETVRRAMKQDLGRRV